MPGYQPISWAANRLKTDEAVLLDFENKNWIVTVEKNGRLFLAADQRYRAQYILMLRTVKHLTDEQIELVLSRQRPPYSLAEVDRILNEEKSDGVRSRPGGREKSQV